MMPSSPVALAAVILPALGLALAGASPPAAAQPPARPTDRLAWMAGCWERRSSTRLVEEQWMTPRVGYARRGVDSLVAWIEGAPGGRTRRVEFPYGRVACPSGRRP
jgi:hypothetical protein